MPTLNSGPLTYNQVIELLAKDESPTLEFKRDMYQLSGEGKEKQSEELVKDILSLANGSILSAGETAFLVLGVEDTKGADGLHSIHGVTPSHLDKQRILSIVNSACEPKVPNLFCDSFEVQGKKLLIITIPPSPYVHETTKPIAKYNEYVVFIRREQSIGPASRKEREVLAQIKQARFIKQRRPSPYWITVGTAIASGTIAYQMGMSCEKLSPNPFTRALSASIAGTLIGALLGNNISSIHEIIYEVKMDWHRISKPKLFFGIAAIVALMAFLFRNLKRLGLIAPKTRV